MAPRPSKIFLFLSGVTLSRGFSVFNDIYRDIWIMETFNTTSTLAYMLASVKPEEAVFYMKHRQIPPAFIELAKKNAQNLPRSRTCEGFALAVCERLETVFKPEDSDVKIEFRHDSHHGIAIVVNGKKTDKKSYSVVLDSSFRKPIMVAPSSMCK